MVVGLGNDVMDVARMRAVLARDEGVLADLFTPAELSYCVAQRYPARHLAARFAAKEALFKALGHRFAGALPWREVEVRRGPDGAPGLVLHGEVRDAAAGRRVTRIHVALAHSSEVAFASVLLEE